MIYHLPDFQANKAAFVHVAVITNTIMKITKENVITFFTVVCGIVFLNMVIVMTAFYHSSGRED
jgi:preprotein translocase subunit SecG